MAFNPYDTLPVADEALEGGGVELLRVGLRLSDQELFITLRSPFQKPDQWGWVLADVTRHLADLYAANSDLTEDNVIAAVAQSFAQTLRGVVSSSPPAAKATGRAKPTKPTPAKSTPAKSARPLGKAPVKKAKAPIKTPAKSLTTKSLTTKSPIKGKAAKSPAGARAASKPKSNSARKAIAGRKGTRGRP
jgi:hypothetical protein